METIRRIVLTGEPKSTQHIYRSTCRGGFSTVYLTAEGKALKERYQWEARSQWNGKPLDGDVALSITLYFGTKRRSDIDNFNKLSLDALTGIVYEDDSQIAELTVKRAYDKARPRIEITAKLQLQQLAQYGGELSAL
jgi:Holliday junction resolvase RusA-like endonuclease